MIYLLLDIVPKVVDIMQYEIDGNIYNVEIVKKSNKNTYIKVKDDLTIYITTNYLASNKYIKNLLDENYHFLCKAIDAKKRKIEKKYWILIIVFIIVFILGILMYFIREQRKPTILERGLQDIIFNVQKMISYPVRFMTNQIDKSKEKNKIYQNYKKLAEQIEQMDAEKARTKELESELQEMKALLELNQTLTEYAYVSATVIARNLDSWYQTITIDKGTKDGIEENMAVVTSQGLIGQILHTNYASSTVKLLTGVDAGHKISVKIEGNEGYIYGLLSGYDEKTKHYHIEGIAENTEIKENSSVVTTGFGNQIPPGILIGTVDETLKDHFDLARTVLVSASVNFDEIRYVTVLKTGEITE